MADTREDYMHVNFAFSVTTNSEEEARNLISDFEDFLVKAENKGVMVKNSRHDYTNTRPWEEMYVVAEKDKK